MEIQINNGTIPLELSIQDPFLSIFSSVIIPFISVIAIIIVGVITWRYNKKQHERTAIVDIFHMLNNSNHKSAEENLRIAYRDDRLMELGNIVNVYKDFAVTVERNYDQVGVLIHEKLIPSAPYYITFGPTTVVSYCILYEELKNIRIQAKPLFRVHFHNLAVDCLHYWYDNGLQDIQPITDPKTNKPIPKNFFGDKTPLPTKKLFS